MTLKRAKSEDGKMIEHHDVIISIASPKTNVGDLGFCRFRVFYAVFEISVIKTKKKRTKQQQERYPLPPRRVAQNTRKTVGGHAVPSFSGGHRAGKTAAAWICGATWRQPRANPRRGHWRLAGGRLLRDWVTES